MRDKERMITSPSSSSSSPSPSSSTSSIDSTPLIATKSSSSSSSYSSKFNYKLCALAAILLLTLWSMFSCSITLKHRTAGTLNLSSDDIESVLSDDLDILEVEEKEKVVKHMWDVYTNSKKSSDLGLPKFWQEAFEAAYEHLVSDDPGVRKFAILEIAKMSMMLSISNDMDSSSSSVSQSPGRAINKGTTKQGEQNKKWNLSKSVNR